MLLLLTALLAALPATAGSDPAGEAAELRVRLKVTADADGLDWLAAEGFDIAGRSRAEGWVEVLTHLAGAARIEERGLAAEVIELRDGPRPLSDPDLDVPLPDTNYTDPGELEVFLNQVAADHPAITRLVQIGTSTEGRAIWAMLVSDNAAVDEDELSILFNAAHHAREVMTPEVVMDTIDYLTDNYGVIQSITDKVDAYEIWCVPMVNPDGVNLVHTFDDFWRKNTRDNDGDGSNNDTTDGVDLNRNYAWGWGNQCNGSSSSWGSQTYRGPHEDSEPEAQAILSLTRRVRPVFDIDYHSYGEDVFYAMSCDPIYSPKLSTIAGSDKSISRVIAEDYAATIVQADGGIGYGAAPYGSRVDGPGRDTQYHENGTISFVTEINTSFEGGFHPNYDTYRQPTVEGHRPAWQWLIDRIAGPAVGGRVTDAVTGEAVAADVSLDEMSLPDGKRLTAEPDFGRYHIIVVPGNYTLRVSAPGYQDATVPVSVGTGWVPTDVALTPDVPRALILEDFEDGATASLWTVDPGSASDGFWEWGDPHGTHTGSISTTIEFGNPRLDASPGEGYRAFVTGNALATDFINDDVDGGLTRLTSPAYDLTPYWAVEVSYWRWLRKQTNENNDSLEAEISFNGGSSWTSLEQLTDPTSTPDITPAWAESPAFSVADGDRTADVRFRFTVEDRGQDHIVEGAVDDLLIRGYSIAIDGDVGGVTVTGGASTVISWNGVPGPGPNTYDVSRGELASLSGGPGGVDLGTLTCIEDDSSDTDTAGNEDTDTPAPGTGRFYVVRFATGSVLGGYGFGSQGGERTGTGGCP